MPAWERKLAESAIGCSAMLPMPAARAQEQADLGLAETVDRLHGVADREHAAAVACFPAGSEAGDQFVLADRGVLEFVDQQVPDAVIERQREISGRIRFAQRAQRALRNLDKVDLAARLEHELETRHRLRQQAQDGAQHFPLAFAVGGWRQAPHFIERNAQGSVVGEA
jgi:hypothetical protein